MSGEVTVRVIRTLAEIEEVRSTWVSWKFHPNSDIDYYLSRFHVRPEFIRPHIIVVNRDGRPDAMLVGRLDHLRLDLKIGYVHLPRPRVRVLNFIYCGLLGEPSPENCGLIVSEITNSLRRGEADLAAFSHIRVGSSIYEAARRLPGFLSRDHFPQVDPHFSMKLSGTMEEMYRGLSSNARHDLRRKAKRLLKDFPGKVEVSCFREESSLEVMIRDLEAIAKKTYQRGLGVGFLDNAEMRQRLSLAARRGWLRSYILYVEDKPCAFWMGTLYQGTFHVDFCGYDPSYDRSSPGTFLLTRMLEGFGREKFDQIDFGYGEERHKQRFSNCKWHEAMVRIYAPTVRGLGIKVLVTLVHFIDYIARRVLDYGKLLPKLKRFWRKQVRNCEPGPAPDETAPEGS